jgi:hypothetical protein
VDRRLKEQRDVADDRAVGQSAPVAMSTGSVMSKWWMNSLVYMALFGLVGGLLGWGCGELVQFIPDARRQANELLTAQRRLYAAFDSGQITRQQADASLNELRDEGSLNPYFQIETNLDLSKAEKARARAALIQQDRWKALLSQALFYSASGMTIAMCLAVAEPLVERNWAGAVVFGSVGATLGLVGGVVVSLFIDKLFEAVRGNVNDPALLNLMLARALTWAVLGVFLSTAAGLVLRSGRKLLIGMAGGLIGGAVGGLLFDPVGHWAGNEHIGRLLAIVAIGVVSGAATGLIENAAKTGWLRVLSGPIAGKQFILYRNPTYIGSSLQCHIYLFKDPAVGRRHAAIHVLPGGFEIENLPLGQATSVNGRDISRARLRNGDEVRIGATSLLFQEKPQAA